MCVFHLTTLDGCDETICLIISILSAHMHVCLLLEVPRFSGHLVHVLLNVGIMQYAINAFMKDGCPNAI